MKIVNSSDIKAFWAGNKVRFIIAGLGALLLSFGIIFSFVSSSRESASIEILPSEQEEKSEIFVHVAGAVEKPGLYCLSSGARVNDALVAAGGLTASADREWFNKSINLAQELLDGIKLYIPFQGEEEAFITPAPGAGESYHAGRININTASLAELDSLPGIGPAYAERIISQRPFAKIEDLLNVSGIGKATFDKIKDQITVF